MADNNHHISRLPHCLKEIQSLHEYLEAWLRGNAGKPEQEPLRLANALDENFTVVHPSGLMEDRNAVIENFRTAFGNRSDSFRICITDPVLHLHSGSIAVVSYTERHIDTPPDQRRSTAVLKIQEDGPTLWLHLHETRMSIPQAST